MRSAHLKYLSEARVKQRRYPIASTVYGIETLFLLTSFSIARLQQYLPFMVSAAECEAAERR